MRALSNEQHEAVYRVCQNLLERSGARAALLCDALTGELVASFGDVSAQGEVNEVQRVSEHETIVRGGAGEMFGVDVRGGLLLAVLHDGSRIDAVRSEAADAATALADLVPPPLPEEDEDHAGHDHAAPAVTRAPEEGPPSKPPAAKPSRAKPARAKSKRPAKKAGVPGKAAGAKKAAASRKATRASKSSRKSGAKTAANRKPAARKSSPAKGRAKKAGRGSKAATQGRKPSARARHASKKASRRRG